MIRFPKTTRARARLAALTLAGCLAAWWTTAGAESPETREVMAQLTRQAKRIESLEVAYKLDTTSDLKPEQIRALAAFRNQLYLPKEERREAFKGEHRYVRILQPERIEYLSPPDRYGVVPPQEPDPRAPEPARRHQAQLKDQYDKAVVGLKAAEARGANPARKDPGLRDLMERDVTRGLNGRSLWMKRPLTAKQDQFQVQAATFPGHWFGPSAYQAAAGLQSPDPTAKAGPASPIQGAFRVADWATEHSHEVEEKADVVDGSTCVVLKGSWNSLFEPAMMVGHLVDRIWLDRDHGLAVRKRELTKDGQLMERTQNSGLREVEPGLWLPTLVRHDRFADDAPPEMKGKPVLTETIRVESVEVNQVADDLFDMPVPKKGD